MSKVRRRPFAGARRAPLHGSLALLLALLAGCGNDAPKHALESAAPPSAPAPEPPPVVLRPDEGPIHDGRPIEPPPGRNPLDPPIANPAATPLKDPPDTDPGRTDPGFIPPGRPGSLVELGGARQGGFEEQPAHKPGEMLKVGDVAPDFRVKDDAGKERTLQEFRGRRVVLWFFPKAATPG